METKNLVIQKIVAILIIFTLIMAQYVIVGITAITYAIDMIVTSENNIQFKAYFVTQNQETGKPEETSEISKAINEQNLKLNIDVAVYNEGYFDGQISLKDAGFKIKEDSKNEYIKKIENNVIYLNQINAEETAKLEVGIKFLEEDKFDVKALNGATKVNLTGTYVSSKQKREISGESEVKVNWKAPEGTKAILTSKLLTNGIYGYGEETEAKKRVVQILVGSKLENNIYPIKNTHIKMTVPEGAENIKVHKRTTRATNGDKEFTESNYNVENNILNISVENNEEEGKISWEKAVQDVYVVTYEFPENIDISNNSVKIANNITTYDTNGEIPVSVHSEGQEISLQETTDGIVTVAGLEKEQDIYKGKIYTGEERQYTEYQRILVDYTNGLEKLQLNEKETKYLKNEEEKNANIVYKSLKINKQRVSSVLGDAWSLTIKYGNETNIITSETEADESGNIIVELKNGTKQLSIETSKPENIGIIEIETTKAILNTNYTREEIKELTKINNNIEVVYTRDNGKTNKKEITTNINLKETESKATFNISKNKLTTLEKNENVELIAKLNTNGENLNLYKNPEVYIVFPKEVSNVKVTNAKALYRNGLEIEESKNHTTEDGRQALYLKLKGEQKTYDTNGGTEIHLYIDIDVDKNIKEDKKAQIEMKYTNQNDGATKTEKQEILIQYIKETPSAQTQATQSTTTSIANKTSTPTNKKLSLPSLRVPSSSLQTLKVTIAQGLEAAIVAKRGNQELQEADTVYEGETIKYTITINNNSGTDYENINIKAIQTNGKVWDIVKEETYDAGNEIVSQDYYKISNSNEINFKKIDKLKNGESIEIKYEAQTDLLGNDTTKTTYGTIIINSENNILNGNVNTIENKIEKAELKLEMFEGEARESQWTYRNGISGDLYITNLTANELKNIEVKIILPKELSYSEEYDDFLDLGDDENAIEIKGKETNSEGVTTLTFNIKNIASNKSIEIMHFPKIENFDEKTKELNVKMLATAKTETNNTYYSNEIERLAYNQIKNIKVSKKAYINNEEINANTEIKDEQEIEIKTTIKNEDTEKCELLLVDNINQAFDLISVKVIKNNTEIDTIVKIDNENECISSNLELNPGETIEIKVIAKMNTGNLSEKTFENTASVTDTKTFREYSSKILFTTDKNIEENNNDNNDNDGNNDNNNENNNDNNGNEGNSNGNNQDENNNSDQNQSDGNETYTITGTAWIDINRNGQKDENEEKKSGIDVKVIDTNTRNYMNITTSTGADGTYSLNLQKGKYIIAFIYDTSKYALTTYQADGVNNSINSDVAKTTIEIDNKKIVVGATDEIDLESNIQNIDIGLVENEKFDLKLDKYVSKVTITNKQGTTMEEFDEKTDIAKVEIRGKYLSGSKVVIEYTLKVTNNGDVAGYATNIVDKIPSALKYESALNQDWYKKGNNLYNETLASTKIEPGESKEVKLILTKTMTASNTGLFKNIANIEELKSDQLNEDIKEDNNQSSAEIIITVSTGERVIFVSVIIVTSILVTAGLIVITKKYIIK